MRRSLSRAAHCGWCECVPGQTLQKLIDNKSGLLSPANVAAIGVDLLHALAALHDVRQANAPRGIVHRDVKPLNIMITPDDTLETGKSFTLTLLDFGIARPIGDAGTTRRLAAGRRGTAKSARGNNAG